MVRHAVLIIHDCPQVSPGPRLLLNPTLKGLEVTIALERLQKQATQVALFCSVHEAFVESIGPRFYLWRDVLLCEAIRHVDIELGEEDSDGIAA